MKEIFVHKEDMPIACRTCCLAKEVVKEEGSSFGYCNYTERYWVCSPTYNRIDNFRYDKDGRCPLKVLNKNIIDEV